ncbi:MAG: sugar transferase [Bryobacterales bacterium]|nr:sugar transferase [Bryobacterales bacterium]
MFERRQRRAVLLLSTGDALLALASFEAARAVRGALPLREFTLDGPEAVLVRAFALAAVLGAGRISGAYARLSADERPRLLQATVQQLLWASLALLTCLYLLHLEPPVSRLFLALMLGFLGALQLIFRGLADRFHGRLGTVLDARASVVIVASRGHARRLTEELEGSPRRRAKLLAVVDCDAAGPAGARRELEPLLLRDVVDEVLVSVPSERLRDLGDVLSLCEEHGVTTRVAADFFRQRPGQLYLDRLGGIPLLTFSTAPADEAQLLVKRTFDIVVAAVCLVVFCIPLAVVALLVKATSKGPVLFRQRRCGLNGRVFTCYKFRSMVADAEARRADVEHLNQKDGPAFKVSDDPRLTSIGGFLRKYSIDEWPQFWNVLRGEMAIVGPRPAVPSEVQRYRTWQRRRLRMRPGLTCLWAIRGRDRLDFESWMQMDLEYIDRWSLLLDLKILALTVPVVLSGRNAS